MREKGELNTGPFKGELNMGPFKGELNMGPFKGELNMGPFFKKFLQVGECTILMNEE